MMRTLLAPLSHGGRPAWGLIVLFLLINGLVCLNAFLHPPTVGYDAEEHLSYLVTLSEGRLPTPEDTAEFFNPPLSYALPALVLRATGTSMLAAAKLAQAVNVLISVLLTWTMLQTCLLVGPSIRLRVGALLCLGMVPVYYKTMAFVRPEPYVALFAVVAVQLALRTFVVDQPRPGYVPVLLGLALGLGILSRQWGAFVLGGVVILAALTMMTDRTGRRLRASSLALALGVAVVTAGWFFLHLDRTQGSAIAFNRGPEGFSLANQPRQFYLGTGSPFLFTHPVRPAFPGQAIPIFYTETWGDYWCYFLVAGRLPETGEWVSGLPFRYAYEPARLRPGVAVNRFRMEPYLGRVNLVSILPTIFMLLAAGMGLSALGRALRSRERALSPADGLAALAFLVVGVSVVGYLWFLIRYPELAKGDTIKASYLLHIYPCLAFLGGLLLERIRAHRAGAYVLTVSTLAAVWAHNLPACITRFTVGGVG